MAKVKKSSLRRMAVVKVTLTESEKTILSKDAAAAGMPLSIYVRVDALEKAQK
jgi:hypothetical protein